MKAAAGIYAAALTPRSRKGDLDFGAAFELLDHLARGRLDGIAMFTAAGEYAAFSLEERARLLYLSCKRSRLPIWAGVGTANFEDSVRLAREARSAGARAVILPPPLLLPYSQEVLREYYTEFASQLDGTPDIYVSGSGLGASPLHLDTALCLMQNPRIAGIVDSGVIEEDLHALDSARARYPFRLLMENDRLLGTITGAGAISACACAVPELAAAVFRGAPTAAAHAFLEFVAWSETLPPTIAVKVATGLRGVQTGAFAVPMPPRLQSELDRFRAWFQDWLPAVKRLFENV